MDPFLGEIRMVGFNYAPPGWLTCDGQTLPISQNTALFALLGVQFGGNGSTTFCLPDLRGRAALHQGNGNGLSPRVMGETGGEENVTLTTDQMPMHTHTVAPQASSGDTSTADPTDAVPANSGSNAYAPSADANAAMAPAKCSPAGGSQPHDNMPPFEVVNFIIATQGIFPSRP